jgi:Creatinase/Prolidase N-terminal domain
VHAASAVVVCAGEVAETASRHLASLHTLLALSTQAKTRVHPTKLAGVSVQDKLNLVREDLQGVYIAACARLMCLPSTQHLNWAPCASAAREACFQHDTLWFGLRSDVSSPVPPSAAEQKVGAVIITALDEVAWLLNLRGGDVDYNPVFISYAVITPDTATLYVDSAKVCALHIHDDWCTFKPAGSSSLPPLN